MKRRIFITALVLMLIISGMSSAFADTPRATFTNEKNTAPNLYVSKTVTTVGGSEVPDADFHFTLMLGGKLAANIEYNVYDKNGKAVENKILGVVVPWKTSGSGDFTLKAGQTAEFEYLTPGTIFEVTETNLPKGFTQITPAGGLPAGGSILNNGTQVEFVNNYIPITDQEDTTLEVSKELIFPDGYKSPSAPEFTFVLELETNAYANENFTIIDMKTGMKTGTGTTLNDGSFKLTGNQIARFEKIKTGIDYRVTEKDTEGWNAVGSTTKEGRTDAPLTSIRYANSNVSFGVSKALSDNSSSDTDFEFTLTDGLNNLMAEIPYYLYNRDGTRADNIIHKTGGNGTFILKADQTAIFLAMEKGTVYNVSEKGDPNFTQIVPSTNEGYVNMVVGDNFVMLPFVNKKNDISKSLTVTKTVSAGAMWQMPLANDEFTFKLSIKKGTGYETVPNAYYTVTVGNKEYSYSTDGEGKFKLKRNETAVFERLTAGEYKVEEIDLNADYTCPEPVKTGVFEGNLNFTINNVYNRKPIDLMIKKENSTGSPLMGARFDLYADEQLRNKINDNPLITDNDGVIQINDIASGTYYLKEIESPKGYRLLTNLIKLNIVREGSELKVYVDEKPIADGSIVIGKESDNATLTIVNYRSFELPITGGAGIVIPILIAIIGIAGISILMLRRHRRKELA